MIILDSSILVEMLRRNSTHPAAQIETGELGVCVFARVEILAGAKNREHYARLERILGDYASIDLPPAFWPEFEQHAYLFKSKGMSVTFVDAALASLAMQMQFPIWTLDNHFADIAERFPALRVFELPEIS